MIDLDGETALGTDVHLDYTVLGRATGETTLGVGSAWTFGRSRACSETLALPELSRVSLVLQHVPGGLRVLARQSNTGRVTVSSDDDAELHVIGVASGPVHLSGGNYTIKVELPPVVLRVLAAVPAPARPARPGAPRRGVAGAIERTALSWVPEPGASAEREWMDVVALAVTLARFPELAAQLPGQSRAPQRTSDALRRAAALWCGHSSAYWVNERLKEAVAAADLHVIEGGDRLAAVVTHYRQFFCDTMVRQIRAELLAPTAGPGRGPEREPR